MLRASTHPVAWWRSEDKRSPNGIPAVNNWLWMSSVRPGGNWLCRNERTSAWGRGHVAVKSLRVSQAIE